MVEISTSSNLSQYHWSYLWKYFFVKLAWSLFTMSWTFQVQCPQVAGFILLRCDTTWFPPCCIGLEIFLRRAAWCSVATGMLNALAAGLIPNWPWRISSSACCNVKIFHVTSVFRGFERWNFITAHFLRLCPDDEGSVHLWNIGKLLPDYIMQHPRKQPYLFCSDLISIIDNIKFSMVWDYKHIYKSFKKLFPFHLKVPITMA
jgi:hypothetical protein